MWKEVTSPSFITYTLADLYVVTCMDGRAGGRTDGLPGGQTAHAFNLVMTFRCFRIMI